MCNNSEESGSDLCRKSLRVSVILKHPVPLDANVRSVYFTLERCHSAESKLMKFGQQPTNGSHFDSWTLGVCLYRRCVSYIYTPPPLPFRPLHQTRIQFYRILENVRNNCEVIK
jgi:hypothetical protein